MFATDMEIKSVAMVVGVVAVASATGCLSCSHCQYAKRAEAAQKLPSDAIGYVDASESYGGFPGADAPSVGTEKTVFRR